jgi:cysteine-rich repeat protein
MRLRTSLGLAALVSAGLVQTSSAVVRPKGAEAPIVSAEHGPRSHRTIAYRSISGFTAMLDHDTDVPLRMWGKTAQITGSVANAQIAETVARQFLAQHLSTLAPGASLADFELVSNVLSPKGDTRSVGFIQRSSGIRVLGGTIGFGFKGDRLAMISSTALPNITVAVPPGRLPASVVTTKATQWLSQSGLSTRPQLGVAQASERVIVPIVRPRTGATPDIEYRVAEQVALESVGEMGSWDVWVDANDGRPIARKTKLLYTIGKVLFDAPDRYPGGTRSAKPAAFATHTVDGVATTSTADGSITWAAAGASSVALTLEGPFVAIKNNSGTPRLTETVSLAPNGTFTWNKSTDEFNDAQINAFVHANIAKQFAKTRVNPSLAWLDTKMNVTVNINQTCNAVSNGNDIFFFRKNTQCENTGRMADVVYHEFGHSIHNNSVIEGVGMFEGGLSEGISDTYASLITRDAGMGRGFFFTNAPLRNLDNNKKWPDDAGEAHDAGEIIGGAMWHMGQALDTKLGVAASLEKQIDVYQAIISRASDIPSSFAEALLADDNDGDISNGTPNQCEITAAFGRHGLSDPTVTLGVSTPIRDKFHVSVDVNPSSNAACPGASVTGAKLAWKTRGGTVAEIPLTAAGTTYAGDIPSQPDGTVVQYQVIITVSDGSAVSYPKNAADPFYEFYVGPVENIKCFDFEDGEQGWTHTATPVSRDEWEAGTPKGLGGDPKTAFAGTGVFGVDLSDDGLYLPSATLSAESPEIDATGHQFVRLQFHRWLNVEDGFFDQARILVNGTEVWKNFAGQDESSAVTHTDREWRFQDIDLKDVAAAGGGKLKIKLELKSDQGLELAGWTVDDVCIVALSGAAVTCGNGSTDDGESCDDGNRVDGDGCSANCIDESPDGGGCCSVGSGPEGAIALSLFTFGMMFFRPRSLRMRRRRRATRAR